MKRTSMPCLKAKYVTDSKAFATDEDLPALLAQISKHGSILAPSDRELVALALKQEHGLTAYQGGVIRLLAIRIKEMTEPPRQP